MSDNIILIGYRGVGKTTVGKALAQASGRPLIVMDDRIERSTGMKIEEYVRKQGWGSFREIESALLSDISSLSGHILDCGGGIVEKKENLKMLKGMGKIFWLKASESTIISRIRSGHKRPSLTGKPVSEEVHEVLMTRTPAYSRLADYSISTDGRDVDDIVRDIMEKMV